MLSKNKTPIDNVTWKQKQKSLNKMIKIDFCDGNPLSFRASSGSGKNGLFCLLCNHNRVITFWIQTKRNSMSSEIRPSVSPSEAEKCQKYRCTCARLM